MRAISGFKIRFDHLKGLKLRISKSGLAVEITITGTPKQKKHFREFAEKVIRAMAQPK